MAKGEGPDGTVKYSDIDTKNRERVKQALEDQIALKQELEVLEKGSLERARAELELLQAQQKVFNSLKELAPSVRGDVMSKLNAEIEEAIGNFGDLENLTKGLTREFKVNFKNAIESIKKSLKGLTDAQKEYKKIMDEAYQAGVKFTTMLGAKYDNLFTRAKKLGEGFEGLFKIIQKQGQAIADTGTFTNFLAGGLSSLFDRTMKQVTALDSARASFVQATSAGDQLAMTIIQNRTEFTAFALSAEAVTEQAARLYKEFNEFSELAEDQQVSISQLAAAFDRFGSDIAPVAQIATKNLGMSVGETEDLMIDLFAAADAMNVPISQMTSDFAAATEVITKFGDEGIDVFIELAAQAKATGLSVNELMGAVGQYDTFEGAARGAQRLNAVLGTNLLNTYSLLEASESERIVMLRQTVAASGQAFESMSRYERVALANAAGIQDLNTAARIFNMNLSEADALAAAGIDSSISQEELAQRAQEAETAMNKLTSAMNSLVVAIEPIIEGINWAANTFGNFITVIDNAISSVVGDGGLASSLTALSVVLLGSATKSLIGYAARLIFGTSATVGLSAAQATLATTSAAAGTATTASAGGIAAIGTAATSAAPGMLAFGAAILMAGGGVALAGLGISLVVDKLAELQEVGGDSVGALVGLSAAFLSLAGASLLMGNPVSLAGLVALGTAFIGLSGTINSLEVSKIQPLADFMSSLKDLGSATADNLRQLPAIIQEIGNAAANSDLTMEGALAFRTMADGVQTISNASTELLNNQGVETIRGLTNELERMSAATSDNTALASALDRLASAVGGGQEQGPVNIQVNMDGRAIYNVVLDRLRQDNRLDLF